MFLTCNYGYSWPAHPMYTPRCSYYMCMHLSTILYSDVHTSLPVLYVYALEHYSVFRCTHLVARTIFVCTWALFCIQMYTPRCSYYICMHLSTILYSDVLSFAPNCCIRLMTVLVQVTFPEITNDIYKDSCCIGLYGNRIGRTSDCMTWKTLVWRWGCSRGWPGSKFLLSNKHFWPVV